MKRIVMTAITAAFVAGGIAAVVAAPANADSVRITTVGEAGAVTSDNRDM
ncbi:hypothetical protein ACTMTF_20420 [Nonomuraea sp. ZG12]|jgi:Ni/Co efflux regulator RcnB